MIRTMFVKRKAWFSVLFFFGIAVGGAILFFHAPVAFLPAIVLAQKFPLVKSLLA